MEYLISIAYYTAFCIVAWVAFATYVARNKALKCSYYKIGKEPTKDDRLWKIKVTEPCDKRATRIYNGIAICEEHFKEKMEDDKENIRKQIQDSREIIDHKFGKLREDIQKEYTDKKDISWKEATWRVLTAYSKRYGFFWAEPLSPVLMDEAIKKDSKKI